MPNHSSHNDANVRTTGVLDIIESSLIRLQETEMHSEFAANVRRLTVEACATSHARRPERVAKFLCNFGAVMSLTIADRSVWNAKPSLAPIQIRREAWNNPTRRPTYKGLLGHEDAVT